MKKLLLAGASLVALMAATAGTASAGTVVFNYTGAVVQYVIPATGMYEIDAYGAAGGGDFISGGKGALVRGDFQLAKGEILDIAVGGQGQYASVAGSGGGGGTFVIGPGNVPLAIAGGGGGIGSHYTDAGTAGYDALIGPGGGDGFGTFATRGHGGSGGYGGTGGSAGGGGGGGFRGSGTDGTTAGGGQAGGLFQLSGGAGGVATDKTGQTETAGSGGFGGGGGGSSWFYEGTGPAQQLGAGGGGGGYSGGGGGEGGYLLGFGGGGGGGGSYDTGANQYLKGGVRTGDGLVDLTLLEGGGAPAVPEPATVALVSTGLAGLAALRRRRGKA